MYQYFFNYDAVVSMRDKLTQLLRVVFYKRAISTDDFVQHHGRYWVYLNRDNTNIPEATNRNNQRRTIQDNKISWAKFRFIIEDIFELSIIRVSITVRDRHGVVTTYSNDDKIEQMETPVDESEYSD